MIEAQLAEAADAGAWLALRNCARLLRAHAWLKALGTTTIMTVFFIAYFHLLRHPAGPVTTLPLTPVDRWIGLQPWALLPYLSLWIYVCLPAMLMESRPELLRFGAGISCVCLIGLGVFYLWPTRVPSMAAYYVGHPAFDWLRGIDAAGNACPSLHVASALFAAVWLDGLLPRLGLGRRARWAGRLWCALIVYSTLAVKQHVLVDVLAGAPLGAAGALLANALPGGLAAALAGLRRRGHGGL